MSQILAFVKCPSYNLLFILGSWHQNYLSVHMAPESSILTILLIFHLRSLYNGWAFLTSFLPYIIVKHMDKNFYLYENHEVSKLNHKIFYKYILVINTCLWSCILFLWYQLDILSILINEKIIFLYGIRIIRKIVIIKNY